MDKDLVLGIDTSNYTTSAALLTREGKIVSDSRRMLSVKKGMRGLRQSEALFQHVNNLPEILEKLSDQAGESGISGEALVERTAAVCASSRPRPVEGSYMPCFLPGVNLAKSIACLLDVPFFEFSHQEGHIAALRGSAGIEENEPFMAFHMSGGTCELLHVQNGKIRIIGGTKDISFGQLLDRVGVAMGMEFPCGKELDDIAFNRKETEKICYPPIFFKDGWLQAAGTETALLRSVENGSDKEDLISQMFLIISRALTKMAEWGMENSGTEKLLLAGGVSSSRTIKRYIEKYNEKSKVKILMPGGSLAKDNAVGIAELGRKKAWP